jgi:glutamine synthetase
MVAVAPAEVEGAFAEGLGIDGSSIEGFTRAFEADVLLHPDPTTFQLLPWRGEIDPTARMFCDITTPDGQPAVSDPRNVLKRTLAKAADRGFTFYTHPEIEFYLLKSAQYGPEGPQPVDQAGYFDNVPGGTAHDFRRSAVRMLEDLGISVEARAIDHITRQRRIDHVGPIVDPGHDPAALAQADGDRASDQPEADHVGPPDGLSHVGRS